MKPRFRILLTGKTGVGKSSFCNYLVDQEIFKTGVGAPVTSWDENFQEAPVEKEQFDLSFVDTVGIEPDNFSRWSKQINKFAGKEQKAQSSNDWIHGIFHLINASSARYEPIDGQTIELLQQRFPASPLQVILTHVDHVDEAGLTEIEARVKELNVPVHRVCSVTKRTRSGTSEPKGKDEVVREFYDLTSGSIFIRYKLLQLKSIRSQVKGQFKQMKSAANVEGNKFLETLFTSRKKKRLQSIASALQFDLTLDKEQEHAYSSFIELLDADFSNQLNKRSVRERFELSRLVDRIESEVAVSIDQIQTALAEEAKSNKLFTFALGGAGMLPHLFAYRYFRMLGEDAVVRLLERTEETVLEVINNFKQELLSLDKQDIYSEERLSLQEKPPSTLESRAIQARKFIKLLVGSKGLSSKQIDALLKE